MPYRENDRPVGAAVPEGMEGTMSSPVILFNTPAVVVDLQTRQRPPTGALPPVHRQSLVNQAGLPAGRLPKTHSELARSKGLDPPTF